MEKLSNVGNNIVGSEIIKISQQIKEIAKTKSVSNLTIGDFNSKLWPIPSKLREHIQDAYEWDLTNYPNSQGELELRESVSKHIKHQFNVDYSPEEILIGGGVRPLIYTVYKAMVNPGEGVIYQHHLGITTTIVFYIVLLNKKLNVFLKILFFQLLRILN
jgi:aspartate aminotransferase